MWSSSVFRNDKCYGPHSSRMFERQSFGAPFLAFSVVLDTRLVVFLAFSLQIHSGYTILMLKLWNRFYRLYGLPPFLVSFFDTMLFLGRFFSLAPACPKTPLFLWFPSFPPPPRETSLRFFRALKFNTSLMIACKEVPLSAHFSCITF